MQMQHQCKRVLIYKKTTKQEDCNKKQGDLLHDNDYRETESQPKVTIHSSKATFDEKEDGSATAYVINGPETNVAAGSGLRGIRWLRG